MQFSKSEENDKLVHQGKSMIRTMIFFIIFLPFLIFAEIKPDKENNVKPAPENNTEIKSEKSNEVKPTVEVKNEISKSKVVVPENEKQSPDPSIKSEFENYEKENLGKVNDYKKTITSYHEILEKTNSQLSMWTNPYGIFVAVLGGLVACLGVLFTVLTIIAVYLVFRQSKEYKDLMKKSLNDHKIALDNLIEEKDNQLKNIAAGYDKSIKELEYKAGMLSDSLNELDKIQAEVMKEMILKLKEQKDFIDPNFKTFKHSGWRNKDIAENYTINQSTLFKFRALLNNPEQSFTVYMRIIANDNKPYWLGFGGRNIIDNSEKQKQLLNESTKYKTYNSLVVEIKENIFNCFGDAFSDKGIMPVKIDCVRLRGSDENKNEITFSYKISLSEDASIK